VFLASSLSLGLTIGFTDSRCLHVARLHNLYFSLLLRTDVFHRLGTRWQTLTEYTLIPQRCVGEPLDDRPHYNWLNNVVDNLTSFDIGLQEFITHLSEDCWLYIALRSQRSTC